MTSVEEVVESLEFLLEDEDVPRSVVSKINALITDLKSGEELSLTINKAVNELEELSEDVNLPAFVRTEIWGVLSQLGALEAQMVKH